LLSTSNNNNNNNNKHAFSCTCSVYLLVAVKGEEDKTITAGSVVTVTVELRREPLIDVTFSDNDIADDVIADEPDEKVDEAEDEELAAQVSHLLYSFPT